MESTRWRERRNSEGGRVLSHIGKSLIEIAVQHREVVEGIKSDSCSVCMNRMWWVYSQW